LLKNKIIKRDKKYLENKFQHLPPRMIAFQIAFNAHGHADSHDPEKPGKRPIGDGQSVPSCVLQHLEAAAMVEVEDQWNYAQSIISSISIFILN